MGTQNRNARMPEPPAEVAPHTVPLWDTRAHMLAADRRAYRENFRIVTGPMLVKTLDTLRPLMATSYMAAVYYRQALHEAVVGRHWTVEWSDKDNKHKIF